MPSYVFEGLSGDGHPATGTLICNTIQEAKRQLQQQGIYITRLEEGAAVVDVRTERKSLFDFGFKRTKVSNERLVDFLRQLATLVEAKLPLVRALTALVEQEEDQVFNSILSNVREKVQGGSTLADAMAEHPQCFTRLSVNMVRAGESGGVLEQSLNRLADFSEEEQDMRSTIKSAMIYPIVLTVVMGGAIAILMTFAVPRFKNIYKGMKAELPTLTKALIGFADFVKVYWWLILIVIVVLVALFNYWKKTPAARIFIDRMKFKLPVIGGLTLKISIARFSRTFGTLVDGGIPILQALSIAKDTAGNVVIENALDTVSKNVKEGERIAKPLRQSGVFPPVVIHMISVGEESGRLGPMLYRIAENYDKQTRNAIKAAMTLLEPMIIVILAAIVTIIILAMLLPMLNISMMGF
jgi:type II secretion system protein F